MGTWFVFDLLLAVSVVVWLLRLGLVGALSAEQVALAMLGLVVLLAIGRARGMSLGRLVFRVGIPVASIATLIVWESGGDSSRAVQLLTQFLTLLVILAGVYFLFYGVFIGGSRKRDD